MGYRHAGAWVHITSEGLGRKGAARLISGDPAAAPRLMSINMLHHVHRYKVHTGVVCMHVAPDF